MFASKLSSTSCNSFSFFLIHSAFLLRSFYFHILHQNCFVFFASGYWFVPVHSPLVGRIFFSSFGMLCLVCIAWLSHSVFLNFSSFAKIFWFISSSCIARLVCCFVLVLFSQHIPVCFFLSSFACWCSFFTCSLNLFSYLGFFFLFWVLLGNTDVMIIDDQPYNICYLRTWQRVWRK